MVHKNTYVCDIFPQHGLAPGKLREVTIATLNALSSALVFPPFLYHSVGHAENTHLQSTSNHMPRFSDLLTCSDLQLYVWWLAKRSLLALELYNEHNLLELLAYTIKQLHKERSWQLVLGPGFQTEMLFIEMCDLGTCTLQNATVSNIRCKVIK